MVTDKLSNGSLPINLKVLMLAALAVGLLVLQPPAQAQQTFDVECDAIAPGCVGQTGPFAGETFTCTPDVAPVGTPSQCTRTLTGQTFACVITALVGEVATGAIHTCTIPGSEAAAPAPAAPGVCPPTTSQEFSERRIQSGAASPSTGVSNAGNNVNLSPSVQQPANTGNVANEQGVVQSCSKADDIDFTGSSLEISPSLSSDNTQTIEQVAGS